MAVAWVLAASCSSNAGSEICMHMRDAQCVKKEPGQTVRLCGDANAENRSHAINTRAEQTCHRCAVEMKSGPDREA